MDAAFGCSIEEPEVRAGGSTTTEAGGDNEARSLTSYLHFLDCIFIS
jgi:hypothetical protein